MVLARKQGFFLPESRLLVAEGSGVGTRKQQKCRLGNSKTQVADVKKKYNFAVVLTLSLVLFFLFVA